MFSVLIYLSQFYEFFNIVYTIMIDNSDDDIQCAVLIQVRGLILDLDRKQSFKHVFSMATDKLRQMKMMITIILISSCSLSFTKHQCLLINKCADENMIMMLSILLKWLCLLDCLFGCL